MWEIIIYVREILGGKRIYFANFKMQAILKNYHNYLHDDLLRARKGLQFVVLIFYRNKSQTKKKTKLGYDLLNCNGSKLGYKSIWR